MIGYVLVAAANFFWGLNFVLAKVLAAAVPPAALTFWRWMLAAAALAWLLPRIWRQRAAIVRHWEYFAATAATGIMAFHLCIYFSAHSASAYAMPLVAACSGVFALAGAAVLFGRRPTSIQVMGAAAAIGGLVLLVTKGDYGSIRTLDFNRGDLWMLLAAAVWAGYSLLLERRPKVGSTMQDHATAIWFALPLIGLVYGFEATHTGAFEVSWQTGLALVYLALLPSIACYWFWVKAIDRIGAARVHAAYYTLPLFVAAQSWVLLDEQLYLYHALAAALIICGAVLATGVVGRASNKKT